MIQEKKLSDEQLAIIHCTGNARINAVAGSGKTSTLIAFAAEQEKRKKILYLAFNRTAKEDAAIRFAAEGLHQVQTETLHSLAFRSLNVGAKWEVCNKGYHVDEVARMISFRGKRSTAEEKYFLAYHVLQCLQHFCQHNSASPNGAEYACSIADGHVQRLVEPHMNWIEKQVAYLYSSMQNGKIPITHEFYLKQFQLQKNPLHAHLILLDEAQDASPVMLDMIQQQKCTCLLVGDTHQQIYSWRYAVNALEQVDFPLFHLSRSYRLPPNIAKLAANTLALKKPVSIIGCGNSQQQKTHVVLGRTNQALLLYALEWVLHHPKEKLFMEGPLQSYLQSEDGISLYDVWNVLYGKKQYIRHPILQQLHSEDQLNAFIHTTGAVQLQMMVQVAKHYRRDLPFVLKQLQKASVTSQEKYKASISLSTVHRAKGMEFDIVELLSDFMTPEKWIQAWQNRKSIQDTIKLEEELNLLYVAITRTKNQLIIPDSLVASSDLRYKEQLNLV